MQANFIHLQLLRITVRGAAIFSDAIARALQYQGLISPFAEGSLRASSDPI